jgi:hypothetical protein
MRVHSALNRSATGLAEYTCTHLYLLKPFSDYDNTKKEASENYQEEVRSTTNNHIIVLRHRRRELRYGVEGRYEEPEQ